MPAPTDSTTNIPPRNNSTTTEDTPQWYVLRFLYRDRPQVREQLRQNNIRTFTPSKTKIVMRHGRNIRMQVPMMWDLLFVHASRTVLDPYVNKYPFFQYKFKSGGKYCEPLVVPEQQMNDFITAVEQSDNPLYFAPDELDISKGTRVRLIGGAMDGRECILLKVKGARSRRLIVEIPDTLYAAIEVQPDLVEIIR